MVRRSKRGAQSDPTGDVQSEKVNEKVCPVEDVLQSAHSGEGEMDADEQNVTGEPLALSDPPVEKVSKEVGEMEEVNVGQSEKEPGKNKEGLETGEGSGLKDPTASRAADVDEVMDHEFASAIAE